MNLDVRDLSYSIGGKTILHDVNLSVRTGEFVGLIGPNGSGKSTLLKCIYRVLKPQRGVIYLDGRNLETFSVRESALRLAVVAQHNYYNFDFSVLDVVMMGRSPHKKIMERDDKEDYALARQALREVGLAGFEERRFSTLSGGEQQRVILARALTQQTECLVLDEPTNHLDIKYQLQLMNIVSHLKHTVLTAVHDLNIAGLYCDKLYALKNGRVVGEGKPQELLTEKFIYDLYDVRCRVQHLDKGRLNIIYQAE